MQYGIVIPAEDSIPARGGWIYGDVVVVGEINEPHGRVPESLRRLLVGEGQFLIRVRARDIAWVDQVKTQQSLHMALHEAVLLIRDWGPLIRDIEIVLSDTIDERLY